ncbi:host specificity factor TipJ family phage tail protein [Vibrio parahaemolyticus]|uniref:host specificity factor TipJ family phage tail protein n=1 Tax=Vibrio parahaemolyticus TaxID=670 RepID=UPI00215D1BFF|nr:host specificity factor TipJ family phage tail protein [Vibrio parahaemolyticus]MCR9330145.1 host specificity factor TipJ family phage tail protein [Vibrio parahaemolyticus]
MTVTIRTFPNKLDRTLFEVDTFPAGQSLTDILQDQIPNFRVMATPPIEVLRNGRPFVPAQWDQVLAANDALDITVRPRDPVSMVIAVVAAVVAGVVVANSMAVPDSYNQTTPDGSPIYDVNAQGNQVRMMGVVPELFGTHGTFPCLVNPAHRYYYNDDEYLLLMTMVSRGYLSLTNDDIQIGNTPVSNYAGDIDTQIKDPGENVTAHPAWLNVYTSPEVGSTSGGGSGIELEGAVNSITPIKTKFNDKVLTLYQSLEGVAVPWWPVEWEIGQRIEISGTPGAQDITESHSYGGWRDEAGTDRLNYWSKAPALHNCRSGDYIQYPVAVDNNDNVTQWAKGMIMSKFTGIENNVEFYAVRIANADGNFIPVSTVPNSARHAPIKFLGRDDGTYRIKDRTESNGTLNKMFPNQSNEMSSWFPRFSNYGQFENVRITAVESLPGKPVGPFFACPVNELTNEIRADIKFPEGIGYLNDNGSISSKEMRIMLQWREDDNSAWKNQEFKRSGATKDQLGNTVHINLGKYCRPQFRAYRITGQSNDTRTWDTIELIRLKAVLESKSSYQDGTTLAVRIRGTNALSRSAENKLFCVPTRLLHVPNGQGGWTGSNYQSRTGMVATNDIAPVLRYISHEIGLDDSNLGQDELLRLHALWQSRGDNFAAQFDNKDTFWEAIKRLLSVGYSVPTLEFGQVIPVRDEPRSSYDHMYQPDNMTGKGLSRKDKLFDLDEPDGIEVEYFSKLTWKSETVLCLLPGDKGANPRQIKAFGVVEHQKAWQFGMRERRLARYARTEYSWGTEMDGFNSRYLDYVALADDVPGYSQNGQLLDCRPIPGGVWFQLDQDITWQDGETHWLALRKPDGRLSGPYQAVKLPGFNEVQISGQLDFTPDLSGRQEFPFWMFGTGEEWSFPALVTGIKPQGTEKVSMTGRNYDPRVYLDDDSVAPLVGNDPVIGMSLAASGSGDALNADRSMLYFKIGDVVRLSATATEYQIRSVSSQQLRLNNQDGSPASLSFSQQPITLTLTARG